jgi:hypothetical protein
MAARMIGGACLVGADITDDAVIMKDATSERCDIKEFIRPLIDGRMYSSYVH